jgi:hypothetical protein
MLSRTVLVGLFLSGVPVLTSSGQCPTILPIETIGSGGVPTQVSISGTAPGCGGIGLRVGCGNLIDKQVWLAGGSESWSISLNSSDVQSMQCSCGDSLVIQATCNKWYSRTCVTSVRSTQLLRCQEKACPIIEAIDYDIPQSCEQRTASGVSSVTFAATVSGDFTSLYSWSFNGENHTQFLAIPGPPTSQTFSVACPRDSPPYKVDLLAVGCPGATGPYQSFLSRDVSFPSCEACPDISAPQVHTNGCAATLNASVNGCTSGVTGYNWNFGDPSSEQPTSTSATPATTHIYSSNGNYTATISLAGVNGGQCAKTIPVQVSGCTNSSKPPPTLGNGNPDSCGWKFWQCVSIDLCGVLAALAFVLVLARLMLLAMVQLSTPVWKLTLDDLLSALSLAVLIGFVARCPCPVLWAILLAAITAVLAILALKKFAPTTVPFWIKAVIVSAILIVGAFAALALAKCAGQTAEQWSNPG